MVARTLAPWWDWDVVEASAISRYGIYWSGDSSVNTGSFMAFSGCKGSSLTTCASSYCYCCCTAPCNQISEHCHMTPVNPIASCLNVAVTPCNNVFSKLLNRASVGTLHEHCCLNDFCFTFMQQTVASMSMKGQFSQLEISHALIQYLPTPAAWEWG